MDYNNKTIYANSRCKKAQGWQRQTVATSWLEKRKANMNHAEGGATPINRKRQHARIPNTEEQGGNKKGRHNELQKL